MQIHVLFSPKLPSHPGSHMSLSRVPCRSYLIILLKYSSNFTQPCLASVSSVQFGSVIQSCPTLCNPMNCSTPGLSVHHQLPEFTQTHVHRVSDAIQPCHPLSSPSHPGPNPSQHQSLFQWVNSSHEVAKVLELLSFQCLKDLMWCLFFHSSNGNMCLLPQPPWSVFLELYHSCWSFQKTSFWFHWVSLLFLCFPFY